MKNRIFSLILFVLIVSSVNVFPQPANRPVNPVSQGDWILSFGIGPAASYYSGSGSGPGFQIAFEKGVWKGGPGTITMGGEFGFSFIARTYPHYKYSWFTTIMAVRSAYHYGWNVKGLDTYGGLALGFRFLSFNDEYYDGWEDGYNPPSFGPHFGGFIGASYFFSPKVGLNGELGYNINFAQIGVIFKLN